MAAGAPMAVMEPKASPQTQPEWRLSAKAVDLLQCFMSGLDDIVLRIARGIAEERQKATNAKELRVEAEDVAAACAMYSLRSFHSRTYPIPSGPIWWRCKNA